MVVKKILFSARLIIPKRPVKRNIYRCDKKFFTDYIDEIRNDPKQVFLLCIVDGMKTDVYKVIDEDVKLIKTLTVRINNNHRRGGQSANRFQNIRDGQILNYVNKVCEYLISHKGMTILVSGCDKRLDVMRRMSDKVDQTFNSNQLDLQICLENSRKHFNSERKENKNLLLFEK